MKPETLHLSGGLQITTCVDINGRYWIALLRGETRYFRDPVECRKFLKLPAGTPSRQSYDSWIASLQADDAERNAPRIVQPAGAGPDNTRMVV